MNCEKCKNRKATLFYADEQGQRHALCSVCGERQSKLLDLSSRNTERVEEKPEIYQPEPQLSSFWTVGESFSILIRKAESRQVVCKGCGTSAEQIHSMGELGCPECYEAFMSLLFPTPSPTIPTMNARMPSARRARLDRQKTLTELRVQLRRAVDGEDFELAATLRDRIRGLENS